MASEKRMIYVSVLKKETCEWCNEHYPDDPCEPSDCPAMEYINNLPTVDAVEVDVVAQMLCDAIGDTCPCNYNGNDEWLPLVCDDGNVCGKHDDPLYCWKQYIKHYGERKDNG